MDLLRSCFESTYNGIKPYVFDQTKDDPEEAHHMLVSFLNKLDRLGIHNLVLDHSDNHGKPDVAISNAAGFNKNADISSRVMKSLGFTRNVIGTVTYEAWDGNPRPRMIRYPHSGSLVNWMGLPGIGADAIARKLKDQDVPIPITMNIMSTPKKEGNALLDDLEGTVIGLRNVRGVDRFELNISCPNTHSVSGKMDARSDYQKNLEKMILVVARHMLAHQTLYLKVSPDMDENGAREVYDVARMYNVEGFTATNSTTNHDPMYIEESPGKGGATGNAVYARSFAVQQMLRRLNMEHFKGKKIIACGGIDTLHKANVASMYATELQIYTPLIFNGPRYLRELRKEFVAD